MKGVKIMEKATISVSSHMVDIMIKNIKEIAALGAFDKVSARYYHGQLTALRLLDLIGDKECEEILDVIKDTLRRLSST